MLYRAVMALREQKTFPMALESPDSVVRRRSGFTRRTARTGQLLATNPLVRRRHRSRDQADRDQQPDIDDVSFTPDGRWVVTTARDNALRVYRADDGSLIHKLSMELPDGSSILEYASSPDGRHIVATSRQGPAHLWNAEAGTLARTLPESLSVSSGAFSPDGQWLATSDNDQIRVWKIGADTPPLVIGEIKEENRDEPHAYFFPDSKHLLISTGTAWFKSSNIEQRKPINTLFEDKLVSSSVILAGRQMACAHPG